MLASTDSETYGLGLSTVEKETSETQLMEAISSMEQLSIDDIASSEERVAELLWKVKNTMTATHTMWKILRRSGTNL